MSYFQATDGTILHYRDHGDGPAIVLLASQGLSGSMWQHLMVRLADQGFRCVALDRRGHGRSDDPATGYDYDRFADDVGDLLTELDLRDVTLVGHSVGSAEAARYLTRHGPDRVSRLMLASTTLPFLARTADNPDGVPLTVMESVWEEWHSDWPRWVGENTPPFIGAVTVRLGIVSTTRPGKPEVSIGPLSTATPLSRCSAISRDVSLRSTAAVPNHAAQ